MSLAMTKRVVRVALPPHLKSVLLALANYARPDGTGCRPSQATLAAWTGRSAVRTKVILRELRLRGLIHVTSRHTPHAPAEYRLVLENIAALPQARLRPFKPVESATPVESRRFPQVNRGDS